jgi:Fuc2NAc and GlcNAc transferase
VLYLLIAFAFIGSLLLTRLLIDLTRRLGVLDKPNERSSHATVIPRGGGLSFIIIFSICISIIYLHDTASKELFLSLFVGGLLVGVIGLWDDYSHINAGVRLFVHCLAAIAALIWIGGLQFIQVYNHEVYLGWYGYLLSLFVIVWLLNLFNFMDGIDGLAGSEAVFVAAGAALIAVAGTVNKEYAISLLASYDKTMFVLLLTLAFSVLGFLVYNWPPAKIFMGDSGSGFLGFIFAVLAIATSTTGHLTIWTWMILLGIFIVDATITLIRRIFEGQRWYAAHRSHAYQHASQRWGSHRKVTFSALIINIVWLLPLAWLATTKPIWGAFLLILAYLPLVLLAFYFRAGKAH